VEEGKDKRSTHDLVISFLSFCGNAAQEGEKRRKGKEMREKGAAIGGSKKRKGTSISARRGIEGKGG